MLRFSFRRIGQIFTPPQYWWGGAAIGLFIALCILCVLGSIDLFDDSTSLGNAILYFLVKISRFVLLGCAVVLVMAVLKKVPVLYTCILIGFCFAVYYFFVPVQTKYGIALIALWVLVSVSLSGGGFFSLFAKKQGERPHNKTKAWISFCLGIASLAALLVGLWLSATPFTPPHLSAGKRPAEQILLPDPSIDGPYAFKEIFYGSGEDLHRLEYGKEVHVRTESVDGSDFIDNWQGITGWLRSLYWGFDSSALPLNGHVWLPEGKGPFPLVMIVHGNHEMMTPSDSGYDYLGSLFASRGFIAVSVDQNFLNGSWLNFTGGISEVPARGWLLLEHLKQWRSWNKDVSSPFFAKADLENIGLVGHSRGGEAIALAAAFNELSNFPGDGNIAFDYGFGIKALAAISPVDAQYKPGGLKTELENIDYFVIHGSHDGDVRSFEGSGQYHRVRFEGKEYHFKSALFVYGANHGQFNSLWGKKDDSAPATAFFDLAQIMPMEEQQKIAKVYLSAFFETALHGQMGYLLMFRNYRSAEAWLPKTLYLNEFADSNFQYIDDDKDNIDISKTSIKDVHRTGEHLDEWKQTLVNMKKGTSLRPVTYLGWKKTESETSSYTITLPPEGINLTPSSVLVFSLANADDDQSKSKKGSINAEKAVDFTIELTDKNGQSASLPLSDYAYLQPPMFVKLMKVSFLDPMRRPERVFQTFQYPLSDFVAKNPLFDPHQLKAIRFIFDRTPQSRIILDTVAFEQKPPRMQNLNQKINH